MSVGGALEARGAGTSVGIAWMVATTLCFVAVTGIVRHVGANLPAVEAAFIRYAFGALMLAGPLLAAARRPPTGRQMRLHVGRGLAHSLGVILWFYAMARIPMAEVTALGYIAPIFVTIGAAIFLGERLQARRVAAVAAALLGALVILRPGFEEVSIGQLAQVLAAPCFAASFLMAKWMTADEDPGAIVAWLSLVVTVVLAIPALAVWVWPTWSETAWLALTAAFATAGHYCMTRAFRAAPITVVQPVQFLQLVWATILGIIAFGEPIDPWVILGGGIVVGAATYISHREARAARRAATPPAAATKV